MPLQHSIYILKEILNVRFPSRPFAALPDGGLRTMQNSVHVGIPPHPSPGKKYATARMQPAVRSSLLTQKHLGRQLPTKRSPVSDRVAPILIKHLLLDHLTPVSRKASPLRASTISEL